MDDFYRYWSPTPQPPPLRTASRICFDDAGFYMGVTLFDEQVEKIRATISDRDNPVTWTDDCVEIMIDPAGTGTGYHKFTTNFLAARHDGKATNMVLDEGWNVEGWKVATSRDAGAWYIEFSLPWSDLGLKPAEGDIWAFDLVRYGYSTGQFRGVTWSLGGSGAAPQNFGYLQFGPFSAKGKALDTLGRIVSRTKGSRFRILLADQVLIHAAAGTWVPRGRREWGAQALGDTEQALRAAEAAVGETPAGQQRAPAVERAGKARARLEQLQARLGPGERLTPSTASVTRHDSLLLQREVDELKWEGLLAKLVAAEGGAR